MSPRGDDRTDADPRSPRVEPPRVAWYEWGEPAFERARREDRPLLLSISTAWSAWGQRMDDGAFADPRAVDLLTARFIAVRVDADERPDIHARYGADEPPQITFLTPDGDPIASEGYLDAVALVHAAEDVLRSWTLERDTLAQQVEADRATRAAERATARAPRGPGILTPAILDVALDVLASRWEDEPPGFTPEREGGAREEARRGPLSAIRLWRYAYHRRGMAAEFNRAFDLARSMVEGGLFDRDGGGFFHFTPAFGIDAPQPHKTARDQGDILLAFAELALSDEEAREELAEAVESTASFVTEVLGTPMGSVFHSARTAAPPVSAETSGDQAERELILDPRVITPSAAAVARGLLAAGTAYDRRDWVERGRRTVDFLLSRLAAGEAGMYHAWEEGSPRFLGILDDQATMLLALLQCYEVTGQPLYFEHARRLARVLERDWHEPALGFRDVAFDHEELGLLAEPVFPLAANVATAEALLWVARLTHDPRYLSMAQEGLAAFAHGVEGRGLAVADYARVVDRLLSAEPEFKVVAEYPAGEPDAIADPLHRAALRLPLAGRTVQRIDRSHEHELMYQLGLPDVAKVAYVCTGNQCSPSLTDPEQLMAAVEELLATPSW